MGVLGGGGVLHGSDTEGGALGLCGCKGDKPIPGGKWHKMLTALQVTFHVSFSSRAGTPLVAARLLRAAAPSASSGREECRFLSEQGGVFLTARYPCIDTNPFHGGGQPHGVSITKVPGAMLKDPCEDRVLEGPASGKKGSKGRNDLGCIRGKGRPVQDPVLTTTGR